MTIWIWKTYCKFATNKYCTFCTILDEDSQTSKKKGAKPTQPKAVSFLYMQSLHMKAHAFMHALQVLFVLFLVLLCSLLYRH